MRITRITLSDKTIEDPDIIRLFSECLIEEGGPPWVTEDLAKKGITDLTSELFNKGYNAGSYELRDKSSADIKLFCQTVLESLGEAFSTHTRFSEAEAKALIEKI